MGAAIEIFAGARTIEVGRDRYVPVKTTNDLLVLRSDVYDIGPRLRPRPGRGRRPVRRPRRRLQAGRRLRQALPVRGPVAARGRVVRRRRRLDLRRERQGGRRGEARRRARTGRVRHRADGLNPRDGRTRPRVAPWHNGGIVLPHAESARRAPRSSMAPADPDRSRAAGLRPAAAGDPRAAGRRGRRLAAVAAELRQLRDGRLRRGVPRRRRRDAGATRCTCPSSARSPPGRRRSTRCRRAPPSGS